MKRAAILIAMLSLASLGHAGDIQEWRGDYVASAVRGAVIDLASQGRTDSVSGLIQALGLLHTHASDRVLVEFSDYYFGESIGEDMNSVITERGRTLLPLLRAQLKREPNCAKKLDCLAREDRDRRVSTWITWIEAGKRVEFVK